ncbi:MAG TPA: bifunctional oligoribonuclease/PAP phosphatase NrnA [Candidatus Gastranaerophilales bacterium]|nr:bifunctional oligoribonuclease/PAP phosphatase NrnA [Candidatus Gastranaerophilales bacterium]
MNTKQKVVEEIKKAKRIIIFHHMAPDGDALGSALALREILEQLDTVHIVDNVITSYIPDVYKYLPDVDKFRKPDDDSLYNTYDLGITVDCASKDRLGEATELFNNAKKTVCIDHHVSNTGFADIDLIETSVSATGEIIFSLIELLNARLDKNIATNLYTSILTDTGGFKFENTKPETFRICADLVEAGADPVEIYKNCYEIKSLSMVKLHARVIDRAVVSEDQKIIYGVIKRDVLNELDASDDFIDGITESLRQVKDVEVALIFKETLKKTTRVSFRSNGLDVCKIANFFGGGGHKLAAGCLIEKNIEESIKDVLSIVEKQISKKEICF